MKRKANPISSYFTKTIRKKGAVHMYRNLAACLLIGMITLTGCGGAKAPGQPSAPLSFAPQPLLAEKKVDGVEVGVRVSRAELKPEETADVAIWAENRGTEPSIYQGCGPGVHLVIEGPGGARLPAQPKEQRYYCAAMEDAQLSPGQRLEEVFTLRIPAFPTAEPVPGGPYVIKASYARGPVRNPLPPVEAEVTVQVGGGEKTISREEAVKKAKADPRVQEWFRTHSGTGLVRQDKDGQWWVNFGDYLGEGLQGAVRDETGIWGRATPKNAPGNAAGAPPGGNLPGRPLGGELGHQVRDASS